MAQNKELVAACVAAVTTGVALTAKKIRDHYTGENDAEKAEIFK